MIFLAQKNYADFKEGIFASILANIPGNVKFFYYALS